MIRLVDLIEDINKKESLSSNDYAQISRLIAQKEEHGHKVKDEVVLGRLHKRTSARKIS